MRKLAACLCLLSVAVFIHQDVLGDTFDDAKVLYEQGEFEQVIPVMEAFVQEHPADDRAETADFIAINSRYELKQYDQFKQAKAAFLAARPDSVLKPDLEFQENMMAYHQGDWAAAARNLDAFAQAFPASPLVSRAQYYKLDSLWNAKKYPEFKQAIAEFETAHPDYPEIDNMEFNKAYLNIEEGKWDEAASEFAAISEKYPQSQLIERAEFYHAYSLSNTKRYQEFYDATDAFRAKYPENKELHNLVFQVGAHHFDDGKYNESAELLEAFIAQYPQSELVPEASYYIAMSQYEGHQYEKFKNKSAEFVEKYPENVHVKEIQYHDALASYKLNDFPGAYALLEKFIAENPDSGMALSAKLYCAMALANEILTIDPESPEYSEKNNLLKTDLSEYRAAATKILNDESTPAHLYKRLSYEYVESFYYGRDWASLAQAATNLMSREGIDKTTQCFAMNWLAVALVNKDERDLAGAKGLFSQVIETEIPYDQWGIELKSSAAKWLSYVAHEMGDASAQGVALSAAMALPDWAEKLQIVEYVQSNTIKE